ncbi:MAG: 4-demethylwyosine synthase TYW1 [Candidatus Freyarchaeota archaeon]|nr:4-demethylwyosine synthase TYW1 [Candidatus Jordarchaeia archaeon]MBS7278492.1 4-demethylwyosine synthase TYW1 [Candidatus Jordarchaeia archaeon]
MQELLVPPDVLKLLKKQKYQIVGRHSAVKKCRWLQNSLVQGRYCYKQEWYNIKSHRCLQMTPTVIHCTNRCLSCWRVEPGDQGYHWDQLAFGTDIDDPEEIVEGCLKAQRKILSGFNPSHHTKVSPEKWREAMAPKHVAISLAGEPTLYPRLSGLIEEFHSRGMTTFLVTNGNLPEVLAEITEPTQLYVSIYGPNKEVYKRVCRPLLSDAWERLMRSLELLGSFSCPTVMRLTLTKGLNFMDPEGYAKLVDRANPTYVECKSYVSVGYSLYRGLNADNMIWADDVKKFAEKIAEFSGYKVLGHSVPSRVTLLSRLEKPIKVA